MEYNHIFSARNNTDQTNLFNFGPGTYDPNNPGWFDSVDDQKAIKDGHSSAYGIYLNARPWTK